MKISISKSLTCLALFCSIFYMQGCGDSNVSAVKNGVLYGHPDAQIGPVFKANFTNIRWASSNKNGKNCVTFTGKISKATHEKLAKLLNVQDPIVIMAFTQQYPDLYKEGEVKLTQKFQAETDSLNKQVSDSEALIEEISSQESKIEQEKHDFEHTLSGRESMIKYSESEVNRTKEQLDKWRIDFQRYKNTSDEAYMKKYLENAEEEHKKAVDILNATREKTAQIQKEYKEWQARGDEAKIEGLQQKIEKAKKDKLAIFANISKMHDSQSEEKIKIEESVAAEIVAKYFWTEGDPVEIEFVVHPEGNLEVKEMKGNSWSKFGLSIADILDGIYK